MPHSSITVLVYAYAVRAAGFEVLKSGAAGKAFNLRYILGILTETHNFAFARRCGEAGVARLPAPLLAMLGLRIPEGQLLMARRPLRGNTPGGIPDRQEVKDQ